MLCDTTANRHQGTGLHQKSQGLPLKTKSLHQREVPPPVDGKMAKKSREVVLTTVIPQGAKSPHQTEVFPTEETRMIQ